MLMAELPTVLIVDPHPISRILMKKMLPDFSAVEAENPEQAFEMLDDHRGGIAAVLLNTGLPSGGSHTFLKKVRENPDYHDLPVIAIAAAGQQDETVPALDWGATDYLERPYPPDIFRQRLQNALLFSQAIRRTKTDSLTGLLNRAGFGAAAEAYLSQTRAEQETAALLMIDVDNFKYINDTKGHAYGDAALTYFAGVLQKASRGNSVIGRLGGDEFVLLLKDIPDCCAAEDCAVEICELLTGKEGSTPKFPLTCSVGIAFCPDDAQTRSDLYTRADEALYEAQVKGKNQYCRYSSSCDPCRCLSAGEKGWLLDEIDAYLFIWDAETGKMCYMNQKGKILLTGEEEHSSPVVHRLLHLDEIPLLQREQGKPLGQDGCAALFRNEARGESIVYQVRDIDWNGRKSRMEMITVTR